MPDVAEHPSNLPSFEDMMRYTADELIDLIVNEANSLKVGKFCMDIFTLCPLLFALVNVQQNPGVNVCQ